MNLRKRITESTSAVRSTSDVTAAEVHTPDKPKTAVGLNAILSEAKAELGSTQVALGAAHKRIQELEAKGSNTELLVSSVSRNPKQPRKVFDAEALASLALSISEAGLLQPVVVRRNPADPTLYQLVAGERRWRAHQQLGKEFIQAVVVDASDADLAVLALAENIARENLTDYEIWLALKEVEAEFPNRSRMAEALGYSRANLYRFFAFDKLPAFLLADLERKPSLMSGNSAYELASFLGRVGEPGVKAAEELWPDVVLGRISQTKFPEMIEALLKQRGAPTSRAFKDSLRLFSGKEQVGSITKDGKNFALKIKVTALSEAHETQLRELATQFFRGVTPQK